MKQTRYKPYGKNAKFVCIQRVLNPRYLETLLKERFNQKFTLVSGEEYFRGNADEMQAEFNSVYNLHINTYFPQTSFDQSMGVSEYARRLEASESMIKKIQEQLKSARKENKCLKELLSISNNELKSAQEELSNLRTNEQSDSSTTASHIIKLKLCLQ